MRELAEQYRNEHRVLVGPNDKLNSREQVELMLRLGYTGGISSDLEASLRYLQGYHSTSRPVHSCSKVTVWLRSMEREVAYGAQGE